MGQRGGPERQPVVARQLEAGRAADHEAQVAPRLAAVLQPAREVLGGELLAVAGQQRDVRPIGHAPRHGLVLAHLDELQAHVASQELLVVLDVVDEGRPEAADGHDGEPHGGGILGPWLLTSRVPSDTSTFTSLPRSWPASTRTSRTSATRTTSSRSPSPASTTRSRTRRSPASS